MATSMNTPQITFHTFEIECSRTLIGAPSAGPKLLSHFKVKTEPPKNKRHKTKVNTLEKVRKQNQKITLWTLNKGESRKIRWGFQEYWRKQRICGVPTICCHYTILLWVCVCVRARALIESQEGITEGNVGFSWFSCHTKLGTDTASGPEPRTCFQWYNVISLFGWV